MPLGFAGLGAFHFAFDEGFRLLVPQWPLARLNRATTAAKVSPQLRPAMNFSASSTEEPWLMNANSPLTTWFRLRFFLHPLLVDHQR